MTGAILGTIPTAFLYFSTYEWCKERLSARGHSQVSQVRASRAHACVALLKVLDSYRSVTSVWSVYMSRYPHGGSGA